MKIIEKKRPCRAKGCRKHFFSISSLVKACSIKCAISIGKADNEKRTKQRYKERREKLKTRRDYLKEAQHEFNAYIRERDRNDPCISCGRHHNGQYHAGHYQPTSSHAELRFDEDNVHKQCAPCNTYLSGNLTHYRKALLVKIGIAKVEKLEGPHPPAKYTIEYLKTIRDTYRAKTKTLKQEASCPTYVNVPVVAVEP